MFRNMSEAQARKKILEMTAEYYLKYHQKSTDFTIGDRIAYAARVYNQNEMTNLVDSSLDFWLTAGRYTAEFEKRFSEYLGIQYCALVNSGSSANLLAFMALTSPLLEDRAIKRGDEVITVAAGFPTTITSVIQFGAVPVFVDISIPQYNINVSQLELAYSPKTKAVILAHTLGNPFDVGVVKAFCEKNNLWLIEDNCDALGSRYIINDQEKFTGTIGDIGTSSFYPPHHMTMGEGGAVYTNNPMLHKIIISMRDWGRDCSCSPGQDNQCGHRYDGQFGALPQGYDHKYVYSHFGYNVKATDMQASIGCAQLNKLPGFIEQRNYNFNRLKEQLSDISDIIILPEPCPDSKPSWFGFLITCKSGTNRNAVIRYIEGKNIQTRMLFAGNMINHPCFDQMRMTACGYKVVGDLPNTNNVMLNSFWVGVNPGMTDPMIDYMASVIKEAVTRG